MLQRNLFYVLGALMLILWAGHPVLSQSDAEPSLKKKNCGDLWPVQQNKKWGYIDKTGKLIIPCKFGFAQNFSEGLAAVEIDGKCGYIDETGNLVIPPQFHWGHPFSEGLALVTVRELDEKGDVKSNQVGYIDRSGRMVIQPQGVERDKWASHFSEGLACVVIDGKYGFIDKTGRQVIPPQYEEAQLFYEGLAAVSIGNKYGFIDRSGKLIIPPLGESGGSFFEGLAHISVKGKLGYIDKTGRMVIQTKDFAELGSFSEGLAWVYGKNGKFGFIDKTGKLVIPLKFDRVSDFSEGLAPVVPVKHTGKPGNLAYINKKGQIVIKGMSTIPDRPGGGERNIGYHAFCGGVARVGLGVEDRDAEGYINQDGKLIWPPNK